MTTRNISRTGAQPSIPTGHHAQWAELTSGPVPIYNSPITLTIPKLNPTKEKTQVSYWSVKESETRRMFLVCLYMSVLYLHSRTIPIVKMVILLPPSTPTYFIVYLSRLFPNYLYEVWSEGADDRLRGKFYDKRRGIIANSKPLEEFLESRYSNREDVIVSFYPDPDLNRRILSVKRPRMMNFDLNLYSVSNLPPYSLLRQVYANPESALVSVLTERADNSQFTVEELREGFLAFNSRNRAGIWPNSLTKMNIRLPDFDDCWDCSMEVNLWGIYMAQQGLEERDLERLIRDLNRYV